MGTTTTFADFIDSPVSEKVFLAEIQPAEKILNWTKTGGYTNVYEVSYLNETITLADGTTETVRKVIVKLEEDGVALTARTSIGSVDSNPGSFYHDTAAEKLYIHATAGADPNDHVTVGYFWIFFSSKGGIIFNGVQFLSYIAANGVPSLSQKNPSIYWGVSQISSGSLILLNNTGFFDQVSKRWLWTGKAIRLLFGGDLLPYSEYVAVFTGLIDDKEFTRRQFSLSMKSNSFRLFRSLPVNDYWTSNYPHLDPNAEGSSIPLGYGRYDINHAPLCTCINTAYAASTYQFNICDHAIDSITQIYIDYQDGAGWQTIAHANENLTAATFTIVSAAFVVGTTRVKAAFVGKKDGSGNVLEYGPHIVEDLLTNILGYAAAELNASSFTTSKARAELALNVFIDAETSVQTIIDSICKSDLAFFDEDGAGLLRYRLWEPAIATGDTLDEDRDFIGEAHYSDDTSQLFAKVSIGYGYRYAEDEYLYEKQSSSESGYLYGKKETLERETYIRTQNDAEILAKRLLMIMETLSPGLKVTIKMSQADKNLGDTIQITSARAPSLIAGGISERKYEMYGRTFSFFPTRTTLELRDIADLTENMGFWMAATVPAYTAASASEKEISGFWCDSDGYAEPGNEASKNISRWW